jgi:hypothetical protein
MEEEHKLNELQEGAVPPRLARPSTKPAIPGEKKGTVPPRPAVAKPQPQPPPPQKPKK